MKYVTTGLMIFTLPLTAFAECANVGGGDDYNTFDEISMEGAYAIVRSLDDLKKQLNSGTKRIFIPGDVVIDVPNHKWILNVNAGQTIFSDRGRAGSKGALIRVLDPGVTDINKGYSIFTIDSNARVSGLRIEGPSKNAENNDVTIGFQSKPLSKNIRFDNNELFGWPWAAISNRESANMMVEYNYIHHNIRNNLGYGVVVQNGNATADIRCNAFDFNRHSIAGSGQQGEGYHAYRNLVLNGGGPGSYHAFDMHPASDNPYIAGKYVHVTENWFDYGRHGTANRMSLYVRSMPTDGTARVSNNIFTQGYVVGGQKAIWDPANGYVPNEQYILQNNNFNISFYYKKINSTICEMSYQIPGSSLQKHRVNCSAITPYL